MSRQERNELLILYIQYLTDILDVSSSHCHRKCAQEVTNRNRMHPYSNKKKKNLWDTKRLSALRTVKLLLQTRGLLKAGDWKRKKKQAKSWAIPVCRSQNSFYLATSTSVWMSALISSRAINSWFSHNWFNIIIYKVHLLSKICIL